MNNIDIYYESIKLVYDEINKWPTPKIPLREKVVDFFLGFAIVIFAISLIPILPIILFTIGERTNSNIGNIDFNHISVGNIGITWLIFIGVSLVLMLLFIWVDKKVDSLPKESPGPPQSLSPEQLSFIAIYESYKELKVFFVSHIEKHIENSLKSLPRILDYRPRKDDEHTVIYGEFKEYRSIDERIYALPRRHFRSRASLEKQVEAASFFLKTFDQYAWFQLDSNTKSILQALISFSQKIPDRLKDKEDLPTVLGILENFSKFIYAYLPEHKTYMENEKLELLQSAGAECLIKFSKEVNGLTSYSRPKKQKESKKDIPPRLIEKLQEKFHGNIFIRFSVWFILILSLTSGAVVLMNQRMTLSPDTMAMLIIGTSVASAAALAGFLPKKPH